jgi:hypothetical protein
VIYWIFLSGLWILFTAQTSSLAAKKDWNFSVDLMVTRCFRTKDVKVRCDSFSLPAGSKESAELEIMATDANGVHYAYGYGQSIVGSLCREHLSRIQTLLRKADQTCITGEGENVLDTGEIYSRWQGLETRFGEVTW